jgi:hypothetical protein
MDLLAAERAAGVPPTASRLGWEEFLHLFILLREVRTDGYDPSRPAAKGGRKRSEVLRKLLERGFDHRFATSLLGLAAAGQQPLPVLTKTAAIRQELERWTSEPE